MAGKKKSKAVISHIPNLSLLELPRVIDLARKRFDRQYEVVKACLRRVLANDGSDPPREPRRPQVRALRLLIFSKRDVLLIAATGFGKSLILHAYTVLTAKITLHLIPLSKLGEEQVADIQQLPGAKPCFLTKDTIGRRRRC
jgi:superfamily II DNA or RNA helicase